MNAFSSGFSSGFDVAVSTPPSNNLLGIPIELLRQRVGLQPDDPSKDAEIEMAFTMSVQVVGDYLGRILPYGEYTESEVHFHQGRIFVKAYPMEAITSMVTDSDQIPAYHVFKEGGVIELDGHFMFHILSYTYTGGYKVLPSVLALVVMATFDAVWGTLTTSGSTSSAGKEVKMIASDGMRVEYFGDTASGSSSEEFGLIPSNMLSMLGPYRRWLV